MVLVAGSGQNRSKVVLTLEDTSASIDSQGVYTKLKFKIVSANADHYIERNVGEFVHSCFPGKVLSSQMDMLSTLYVFSPNSSSVEVLLEEDEELKQNIRSKGLFSLVITKAECQNVYKKLKHVMKEVNLDGKYGVLRVEAQSPRYLTEFDMEINPLDVFLGASVLETLLQAAKPFANFKFPERKNSEGTLADMAIQLSNQNLPMLYLKSKCIRVFLQ